MRDAVKASRSDCTIYISLAIYLPIHLFDFGSDFESHVM